MESAWKLYSELLKNGIPEEDSRFVLPNATSTNIVITMNARELIHFFELRCCITAQWEIRKMAQIMLMKVKKVAPIIFEKAGPPCSECPEDLKSCEMIRTKNRARLSKDR
jgi:thymidylate synthase (FAD)